MSEEVLKQEASAEAGSEGSEQQPEEKTETVDFKALYEQEKQQRENLAAVLGRQGQELGELRKMIQGEKIEKAPELNPTEYFDLETAKAIEKVAEQKAKAMLESYQARQEEARLRNDFQGVYTDYDVTEENLSDLAYYASSKGVTIRQAAETLATKGIIEKRTIKATPGKSPVDHLKNAPMAPKVSGAVGKGSTDPTRMSPEQWAALPADQREDYLRKASGL